MGAQAHEIALARWEALGTSVVLMLTERAALPPARAAVERELAEIDRTCSRFREDSELERVNRARGRALAVDPLLIEAVGVALRAAELTAGAVDPTIGRAILLAGYDRDWRELDPAGAGVGAEAAGGRSGSARPVALARVSARTGWRVIELDRGRGTLRIPDGVSLDLGATAKAWAADRAGRIAHELTGAGVLLSIGGDVATAGEAPAGGWRVRVTDDHRSSLAAPGQTVTITAGGIATSSTVARRWSHEGRTMHHIIDPATSRPVAGVWRTASVAAGDCTDANIASTAALVQSRGAAEWLEARGLPARLVDRDGGVCTVGGWPEHSLAAERREHEGLIAC